MLLRGGLPALYRSHAAAYASMRHALELSCSMPEAEASRGAGSKEEGVFDFDLFPRYFEVMLRRVCAPVQLPLQHALLRWQANSACQDFILGMFTSAARGYRGCKAVR